MRSEERITVIIINLLFNSTNCIINVFMSFVYGLVIQLIILTQSIYNFNVI
jgi:hypothetical protein